MLQFEAEHTRRLSTATWGQPSGGAAITISEGLQLGIAAPSTIADELFWRAAIDAMEMRFRSQADALIIIDCEGMYGNTAELVGMYLIEFFDCVYAAYDRCCANVSVHRERPRASEQATAPLRPPLPLLCGIFLIDTHARASKLLLLTLRCDVLALSIFQLEADSIPPRVAVVVEGWDKAEVFSQKVSHSGSDQPIRHRLVELRNWD